MGEDEQEKENNTDEPLDGEPADDNEIVPIVAYDVTSYGSDPEVEGLVNRLRRGDIVVPPFQRDYVWRQPEASKFIESLLLGLPVPGIFFATDLKTNKQLVIDGQQRLKTLRFFYDGYFNPRDDNKNQRVFSLTKVQPAFEGKTYKTLEEHDRIRLDTSIIHATTVKQSSPAGDDTSIYHIFARLNSGGRRLTDHEIRVALYHGSLIELLRDLNKNRTWRGLFGKIHSRLKDQELILRFFSILFDIENYQRPLSEFLNKYAGKNQHISADESAELSKIFINSIETLVSSVRVKPFRLAKNLNVAVFDSCMVGMARRLINHPQVKPDPEKVGIKYQELLQDKDYLESVSRSTADAAFVQRRIQKATEAFAEC